MALWLGILSFVPVGQLTRQLPTETLEALAPVRAQLVNGLAPEVFRNRVQGFHYDFPLWLRYLALTTWQGELSDFAPLFLRTGALRARALKLGDPAAYFRFSGMDYDVTDVTEFDQALLSGDPAIQATAMVFAQNKYINENPALIKQTPGFRQAMSSLASQLSRQDAQYGEGGPAKNILGGLQLLSLQEIIQGGRSWEIAEGWLKTAASRAPEGQIGLTQSDLAGLQNIFLKTGLPDRPFDTMLVELGVTDQLLYQRGKLPDYLRVGLEVLQPNVIRKLLRGVTYPHPITATLRDMYVSRDVVRRAREMLEVLSERKLAVGEHYLVLLRVICGLPIETAAPSIPAIRSMLLMAHPDLPMQLPEDLGTIQGINLSDSAVHYDIDHLLEVLAANQGLGLSQTDIAIIYSYGKLAQNLTVLRQAVRILRPGWNDQLQFYGEPLHTAELLQILQKYGKEIPADYLAKGPIEVPAVREFYRRRNVADLQRFLKPQAEADTRMERWREYYRLLQS